MGVSDAVAGLLGLSEPSARFLVALYAAYPCSILYRLLLMGQHPTVKNAYLTLAGMTIMYYIYGWLIWHTLVDVLAVYVLLRVCGGTALSVGLTWIITMGHLMYGYVAMALAGKIHSISWTIPHCVLVLKLIGLSFNLYDANKPEDKLKPVMKETVVRKMPSLLEVFGFSYFHGSVLAGPQMSFLRYTQFVNGELFDWKTTPSSVPAGILRLLAGVGMSVVYSLLNQYLPLSLVISEEYNEYSYPMRLVLMVVCGKVALWRYITVWMIAEGSCIITGVSYNGKDEAGNVDWHGLANIHFFKSETGITLQSMIDSFNINTNKWIGLYVYVRLRWLNNKLLAWLVTLSFVSLWHGIWPGYALCFSFEILSVFAERIFVKYLKQLCGGTLSEFSLPVRVPLTLLAAALRNLILIYPLTLFMLLSWEDCYKFMKSLYFFGHVVAIGWCVLYYTVIERFRTRKPQLKKE